MNVNQTHSSRSRCWQRGPIKSETPIKPKPKPIQAETLGWSEWRLIKPIQVEVDADEEDQQRVNEKRRGWLNPLTQVEKKRPTKRLIKPIKAESEWGMKEKEKRSREERDKKWEKRWPAVTREREKKNNYKRATVTVYIYTVTIARRNVYTLLHLLM